MPAEESGLPSNARLYTSSRGNEGNTHAVVHLGLRGDSGPDAAGFGRAEAVALVVDLPASRNIEYGAVLLATYAARIAAKTSRG